MLSTRRLNLRILTSLEFSCQPFSRSQKGRENMEELKSEKPFNTDAHVGWLIVHKDWMLHAIWRWQMLFINIQNLFLFSGRGLDGEVDVMITLRDVITKEIIHSFRKIVLGTINESNIFFNLSYFNAHEKCYVLFELFVYFCWENIVRIWIEPVKSNISVFSERQYLF